MCRTPTLVQHKNHLTGEKEREERKKKRDEEEKGERGGREGEWGRVSNNKVMTKNALMQTYIPQRLEQLHLSLQETNLNLIMNPL